MSDELTFVEALSKLDSCDKKLTEWLPTREEPPGYASEEGYYEFIGRDEDGNPEFDFYPIEEMFPDECRAVFIEFTEKVFDYIDKHAEELQDKCGVEGFEIGEVVSTPEESMLTPALGTLEPAISFYNSNGREFLGQALAEDFGKFVGRGYNEYVPPTRLEPGEGRDYDEITFEGDVEKTAIMLVTSAFEDVKEQA